MQMLNTRMMKPEEVLTLITREAVNIIAFGGNDSEVEPHKQVISLMPSPGITREQADEALALIQKEREAVTVAENGGPMIHAVPLDSLMDTVGPKDMLRLLWSMFGMSVRLENPKDRNLALSLAEYILDSLDFESFIEQ